MKQILTLIFLLLLLSCTGRSKLPMWCSDLRCEKIENEADKEAKNSGFCYNGPLIKGKDSGAIDPDPEKCRAFYEEAVKKCDTLPQPPGPDDIEYSRDYGGQFVGETVMLNGKPACFYFEW